MKTLNKALLASTLMVASTASFAASYDLGVIGTAHVTENVSVAAGSFTDTFTFTIPTMGAASVSNVELSLFGSSIIDINALSISLFDAADSYVLPSYDSLAAGSYTAKVTGTATGTSGGMYTFAAVASPVPEASTLSLMMAGFGLVGLMSYRRRNSI